MPTLKEKLMAAKAEGELRATAVRDYSGTTKEVKPKKSKPKAEKKTSTKSNTPKNK